MFTGFASENTPAIQVWDFFNSFASGGADRQVSLADDCAPIQIFKTGATGASFIRVYLPSCAPEGKLIQIINSRYGSSNQYINIYSADTGGTGTNSYIYQLGTGCFITLIYSKNFISLAPSGGLYATGWTTLNQINLGAINYEAAVLGGEANHAGGLLSTVVGGNANLASGQGATVLGGTSCTASGNNSVATGNSTTATGATSGVFGGQNNAANAQAAVVLGGRNGTTRSVGAKTVLVAHNGALSTQGGAQLAYSTLARQTTDATATTLTTDTSAAATTNQVTLPNNSAYYFKGRVIANVTGGGNTSSWVFEGAIKRGANAASTTLVAAVTPTLIVQDAGASAWVVAVTADTTLGCLNVTVTGAASTTIRWVCNIETTEVTF